MKGSCPPFYVAEVRAPARVAGLHQIRENVGVEQDDCQGIADGGFLSPGAVDFLDECADVFARRHDADEGLRIEWFRAAFPG